MLPNLFFFNLQKKNVEVKFFFIRKKRRHIFNGFISDTVITVPNQIFLNLFFIYFQKDAHNCILDFDKDTSYFAVYDGHGGAEVALYCSKKLPDFLKNTEAYKNNDLEQALKDAFLGFDAVLLEKSVIQELKELANIEEQDCSDSEPEEGAELDELREEGIMPLNELLEKYSSGRTPPKKDTSAGGSSSSTKSSQSMPTLGGSTRTFRPRAGGSGQSSSSSSAVAAISSGQCSSSSSTTPKKEISEADEAMVTSSSCKSKIDNSADTVNEPSSTSKITKTENEVSQTDSSTNGTELKKENYSCPDSSSSKKPDDVPVEKPESSTDSKDEISSKSAVNGTIIESKSPDNGISTNSVSEVSSGVSSSVSSSAVAAVVSSGGGENGEVSGSVVPAKETKKEKISSSNVDEDTSDEDENDADVEFDVAYSDSDAEDEPEEETSEDEEDSDDVLDDEDEAFMSSIVEEPGKDSGCTAVVALLHGKDLYVANAGDSRCVVCRNGKSLDMSVDHKPEDNLEYTRIKNAGGRVSMDGRVNGGLNLSRAIGDHAYKMKKDLPAHEQMISAQPDIKKITITDEDEFMILACDGIWNSLTSAEVVEFIKKRITEGTDKISKICEEVSLPLI